MSVHDHDAELDGQGQRELGGPAEWDRWYTALEQHERGHIDATAWIFDNMDETMIGLTPSDAEGQFGKFVYDAQQASERYDAETNHGLNDGTVMDTSIA